MFICAINIKEEEGGIKHYKNKNPSTNRSSKATAHVELASNASNNVPLMQNINF